MIILYDKRETNFTTLGIGVLKDATSCIVSEELNGSYELEMEYPVSGAHYKDLTNERLIFVKPNDFDKPQAFRIYKITRPIDGLVTVSARHISYDTIGIPIRAINASSLDDLCTKINSNDYRLVKNSNFKLHKGTDKTGTDITFKTNIPYSFRSLLAGTEDSILDTYTGEYIFDNFDITLCNRRGKDRNFTIRYSKNMTDLEHEADSEKVFDAVCPYYNGKVSETKTGYSKKYNAIYLSNQASSAATEAITDPETGQLCYPNTWLAYTEGGSSIGPITTFNIINQIQTEGDFYGDLVHGKVVYEADGVTRIGTYIDIITYHKAYIDKEAAEFEQNWLYNDEELTQIITPIQWNPNNLPIGKGDDTEYWNPEKHRDAIYRIFTGGDKLYTTYIYKTVEGSLTPKYVRPEEGDGVEEYLPQIPTVSTETEEKDNIILYEGDVIYIGEVRADINPNKTSDYGSDWLIEITEENEQKRSEDPRWIYGNVIDPTLPKFKGKTFKVCGEEESISAYPITDKEKGARDWLSLTRGSDVPVDDSYLTPNRLFHVFSTDPNYPQGEDYYRWNAYDKKYVRRSDVRYSYKNYIWNGSSYVERDSSTDKILTLDLTDKFNDNPTDNAPFQKNLYDETIKYVKENKIGEVNTSIKVSFVKLSSSPEYEQFKQLEHVELGDTVRIIYEDLDVDIKQKVIKTEYNAITETYESVELGEKQANFTNSAIVEGDNVSSLTNDRNFADTITVGNIVADNIKASYLSADEAEIQNAHIDSLTAESITAKTLNAERFNIDNIVSDLLTADDAVVKNTLMVGDGISVAGDINVKSGSISITDNPDFTSDIAYINPNATAQYAGDWLLNDIDDTQPLMPVVDKVYKVYDRNDIWTRKYYKFNDDEQVQKYEEYEPPINKYFEVDESGNVLANSLTIDGGKISIKLVPDNVYINPNAELYSSTWLAKYPDGTGIIVPEIDIYYLVKTSGTYENKYYVWDLEQTKYVEPDYVPSNSFDVDKYGHVEASSMTVTHGNIQTSDGILNGISSIKVTNVMSEEVYNSKTVRTNDLEVAEKITVGDIEIYQDQSWDGPYSMNTAVTVNVSVNPDELNIFISSGKVRHKFAITVIFTNYPSGDIKTLTDVVVFMNRRSYVNVQTSSTTYERYYFSPNEDVYLTIPSGVNSNSAVIEYTFETIGNIAGISYGHIFKSVSPASIDYYVKRNGSVTTYIKSDVLYTNGYIGQNANRISQAYINNIDAKYLYSNKIVPGLLLANNMRVTEDFPVKNEFVRSGVFYLVELSEDQPGISYTSIFGIAYSDYALLSGITIRSVVVSPIRNSNDTDHFNIDFDSTVTSEESGVRIYDDGDTNRYAVICTYTY